MVAIDIDGFDDSHQGMPVIPCVVIVAIIRVVEENEVANGWVCAVVDEFFGESVLVESCDGWGGILGGDSSQVDAVYPIDSGDVIKGMFGFWGDLRGCFGFVFGRDLLLNWGI